LEAQALVPLAQGLGVAPTIIDPRTMFAAEARFAGLPIDRRWPDEALTEWKPNAASAVEALTHDPKLEDVALAAALWVFGGKFWSQTWFFSPLAFPN